MKNLLWISLAIITGFATIYSVSKFKDDPVNYQRRVLYYLMTNSSVCFEGEQSDQI